MRSWLGPCLALSLICPAEAFADGTVVLVFDIEDKGSGLGPVALDRMTEYLTDRVAAGGAYRVVPRSQLKERLTATKSNSYQPCYEASCQIEIGKELAAQQTLSARIIRLGSRCTVSSSIYDGTDREPG